jgi:PAS domain S-box-containing protein
MGPVMKKGKVESKQLKGLRKQAEKVVREKAGDVQGMPAGDVQELIHELQVHQIELEMQNDELRRAQGELEDSRNKYYELYDFAPIGYFTLDQNGLILEANLAGADMLGIERRYLIKRAFSSFVVPAYHELFNSHRKRVLETRTYQTCELKLHRNDGNAVCVQMGSVSVQDDGENIEHFRTTIVDTTERKRAEEALRESEERFRDLYDEAPNAYFSISAVDGSILRYNAQALRLTGYDEKTMMRMKAFDLYADTPHGVPKAKKVFKRFKAGESIRNIELQMKHKDGSPIWISLSAEPLRDHNGEIIRSRSIVVDISEQKLAEEALKKERDFISAVLSTAGALVVVLDRKGQIIRFNRACELLTGYSFEEVRGRHFWDLFLIPEEVDSVKAVFAELKSGQFPSEHENYWVAKDGTGHLIMWSNTVLLNSDGLVEHVIGTGINISQWKEAEEALKWESKVDYSLSKLYKPLISPSTTVENITYIILNQAKRLTASEHGYVSSIDPTTGDNVAHTLTEMLKGQCRISGKNRTIIFPRGEDGLYLALWGHSLNTLKAFYTNSPKIHKASTRIPEGHIPIHRFLSVPVMLGEELVGQIALANKEADYTGRDLIAVERLAEFYALAIQRKRAEKALKKAHDELERRVEERTADLKRLSSRLLRAQEEERKRIALELHDGIGQSLSAIKFTVENAIRKMGREQSKEVTKSLEVVIPTVQGAVEEVRRISKNLRPSILDDLGIFTTISWFVREFEAIYPGIRIEKQIGILENDVPDSLKIVIYRILQEAFTNIAKHSQANLVRLSLGGIESHVELTIHDNGVGFDVEQVPKMEKEPPSKPFGGRSSDSSVIGLDRSLPILFDTTLGLPSLNP